MLVLYWCGTCPLYLEFPRLSDACEGANWGHSKDIPHSYFLSVRGEGDDVVGVVTSSDQRVEVDLSVP